MSSLVFSRIFLRLFFLACALLSFLGSAPLFSVVFFLLHLLLCGHHLVWMDEDSWERPWGFSEEAFYLWMMLPLRTRFWRDEYGLWNRIGSDRTKLEKERAYNTNPRGLGRPFLCHQLRHRSSRLFSLRDTAFRIRDGLFPLA